MYRGDLNKVIIVAPPQHGKSELVSVRFPAWWLAQRPDDPIVLTSYAAGLANEMSGKARDLVDSPLYQALYPEIKVAKGKRARNRWAIAGHRGGVRSAGVGGGITGHGAAVGIIDDPIQDWAQAQSQLIRDKVWDWYRGTFRQRLWKHAPQIVMHTRWHHDDLAGRLLHNQAGQWHVLYLPAIALGDDPLGRAPGEPLAPSRYPLESLLAIKQDVGPVVWEAVYQGHPVPLEGGLFNVGALRARTRRAAPLDCVRSVRYWDWAGEGQKADYTAGGRMDAESMEGPWWIVDMRRGQWGAAEIVKQVMAAAADDGKGTVIYLEVEPGSAGEAWARSLARKLKGYRVRLVRPTGKKWVRAMPLAAQIDAGNVYMVHGYWNDDLLGEMAQAALGRDAGVNDDQWDSLSGSFNGLRLPLMETSNVDLYASAPKAQPKPDLRSDAEVADMLAQVDQE